jgi:hypothetical protein
MNKYWFLILFIYFQLFFSCVGLNDWRYKIINNYEIWHINSNEIVIGYVKDNGNSLTIHENSKADGRLIGIPPKVIEFCNNEKYICAKVVLKKDWVVNEENYNDILYYVVDTEEKIVFGPLDEEKYNEKINDLLIKNLSEWKIAEYMKLF